MKNRILTISILLSTALLYSSCVDPIKELRPDSLFNKVFDLPNELSESSGLIFYNSLLWSFNDSGNEPVLFGLSTTDGSIEKQVMLQGIQNTDWEDIAQDDNNIYIGDFGNNYGNRKNLCIYVIKKSQLADTSYQQITADSITFYYCDQNNFDEDSQDTPFDCEALFAMDDSLYLVTKNWTNENAALYRIPKTPGNHMAIKHPSFTTVGLVTGADYSAETQQLVLCGYSNYVPFITVCDSFRLKPEINFSCSNYTLVDLTGVQIEGVAFKDSEIYLTCENSGISQALFKFIRK